MRSFASIVTVLMAALMLTFAAPTYTYAQCDDNTCQTYELYRLPEGRRCTVDGQTFQCFDLTEYGQLLLMDIDLSFYELAYPAAQERIRLLEESDIQLRLALDASDAQVLTLQEERMRLLENWQEENRLRLEAENRPDFGSWIAWGLAAAEAVALLVLSIITGVAL